jgi:hypothetical protein
MVLAGRGLIYRAVRAAGAGGAALALAVVALAVVAPGAALASWTPGIVLNAPGWAGGGYSYATAVNRYGHTLFALGVLKQGAPGHWQVQVRTRSSNGVLGPLHAMSMPIPANDPPETAAAVSDSGSGVVAWVTAQRVMAGLVSAAGKPGRLLTLSLAVATAPSLLRVVMSPAGEAFVAWDGNQGLQARFISPAGKPGPVLRLGGGGLQMPQVAISRSGVVTVASTDILGVEAVRVTPRRVSPTRLIIATGGVTIHSVTAIADDTGGDTTFAIIAVRNLSNGGQQVSLMARDWYHGGTLGPAVRIAPRVDDWTSRVAVVAGQSGDSVLAWTAYAAGGKSYVYSRRFSPAGKLGPVVTLGTGFGPVAALDPSGSGMVIWQSCVMPVPGALPCLGPFLIWGRLVTATGAAFGRQFTLTSDGIYPVLGESWAGKLTAVWVQATGSIPIRARFGP